MLIIEEIKTTKNFIDVRINGEVYTMMKENLKWAVTEVKRWQFSGGTNFSQKLIQLIAKADDSNKEKLLKGFPEEVSAYLFWYYKNIGETHYNTDEEFFEAMNKLLEVKE